MLIIRAQTKHEKIYVEFPESLEFIKDKSIAYKYTCTSREKTTFICPDCGAEKYMSISQYYRQGLSCNSCGDGHSYPSKFVRNFLLQLHGLENVRYEFDADWCKPYRYDVYFEYLGNKYIIEADGGWHKQYNTMTGQTAEEAKAIDDMKDELASKHNIEVIRIDCFHSNRLYISTSILQSKLADIFDLSNIDWIECDARSQRNMVKVTCDYHNKYPEKSNIEISKDLRIGHTSVRRYLEKGYSLGWCEYTPSTLEERRKMANKATSKAVDVFDLNGNYIKSFDSIAQCSRLLSVGKTKYTTLRIRWCCNGKLDNYNGYIFKFKNKFKEEVAC